MHNYSNVCLLTSFQRRHEIHWVSLHCTFMRKGLTYLQVRIERLALSKLRNVTPKSILTCVRYPKVSLDVSGLNLCCLQAPILHTNSMLIHIQKLEHNFFQAIASGFICPFMSPLSLEIIVTKLQKVTFTPEKVFM